jgi:hypothetical protein
MAHNPDSNSQKNGKNLNSRSTKKQFLGIRMKIKGLLLLPVKQAQFKSNDA